MSLNKKKEDLHKKYCKDKTPYYHWIRKEMREYREKHNTWCEINPINFEKWLKEKYQF